MTITYKFKGDGDALTGTVSGEPGQWIPIRDGKINGTKISFAVDVEYNKEMKITNDYTGLLLGNELQLSFIIEGAPEPTTFVAKRVR